MLARIFVLFFLALLSHDGFASCTWEKALASSQRDEGLTERVLWSSLDIFSVAQGLPQVRPLFEGLLNKPFGGPADIQPIMSKLSEPQYAVFKKELLDRLIKLRQVLVFLRFMEGIRSDSNLFNASREEVIKTYLSIEEDLKWKPLLAKTKRWEKKANSLEQGFFAVFERSRSPREVHGVRLFHKNDIKVLPKGKKVVYRAIGVSLFVRNEKDGLSSEMDRISKHVEALGLRPKAQSVARHVGRVIVASGPKEIPQLLKISGVDFVQFTQIEEETTVGELRKMFLPL